MAVPSNAVRSLCRAKLAGTVVMLGYGKKDRRVADRVDHDEIDGERGDEGFDHPFVIRRQGWRPALNG